MRNRGITFIEIIIAIVIFGLSLPALFRGLLLAYDVAKKAGHSTSAIALCQERIEEMKNASYANITSTNFPNDQVTLDNHGTVSTIDDLVGSRTVTITDNTNPTYKIVAVTVTWKNGKFKEAIRTIFNP